VTLAFPASTQTLTESARAVFQRLAIAGPTTRPALSSLLHFSKPTMSTAVAELTALGLVSPLGILQGATGRKATVYGLGIEAGHVIGVDAGATQVRAMAQTLDGRMLAEADEPLPRECKQICADTGTAVNNAMKRLRRRIGGAAGPLRAIAVAVPVIVSRNRPELARHADLDILRESIGSLSGARLVLENNVNCAALAELHRGAAVGRSSFAYLQVGVKIGLGIVHEGRLFRGFNGAAGEVARLPYPWAEERVPQRNGLEEYLGSQELLKRVGRCWPEKEGPAPVTARELFDRADQGCDAALQSVRRHAADVGRLAAAVVGIIDPGLVILGGGVGQNPLLVAEVERTLSELAWPTEVASSVLGNRGSVLGASQLAALEALGTIVGQAGTSPLRAFAPS
jgi:predicted NBD/HSP70 family sugar kinase